MKQRRDRNTLLRVFTYVDSAYAPAYTYNQFPSSTRSNLSDSLVQFAFSLLFSNLSFFISFLISLFTCPSFFIFCTLSFVVLFRPARQTGKKTKERRAETRELKGENGVRRRKRRERERDSYLCSRCSCTRHTAFAFFV